MMADSLIFLDANAIVYALDITSPQNKATVSVIQRLTQENVTLCTSHHVIEEVLHIARKISRGKTQLMDVMREVSAIPDLVFIEPHATIDFAKRYAELGDTMHMGVNDALLLQLMIDAGITKLFSYDKQFVASAAKLQIEHVG